jgi:hypothetical protein
MSRRIVFPIDHIKPFRPLQAGPILIKHALRQGVLLDDPDLGEADRLLNHHVKTVALAYDWLFHESDNDHHVERLSDGLLVPNRRGARKIK